MNKKPTILAVAALGSLALIGTGFAGWVIVANATSTASGNITAYQVTDNRLDATGTWAGGGSIVFGKPSGASETASTWFKTKDVGEEKLSDTYTLSIKSKNKTDNAEIKVSAKLAITENDSDPDTKTPYADAVKNNWIKAPTLTHTGSTTNPATNLFESETSSITLGLSEGTATAEFAFTFAWGSHFGGENPQNPFTYYNNKEAGSTIDAATSETYGDDAAKVMGALGKINQTKFSITFTIERAA